MPLLLPSYMASRSTAGDSNPGSGAAAVQVASDPTTAHTLGTVTEVIASTDQDAYGLMIEQCNDLHISAKANGVLANFYIDTGSGDQLVIPSVNYGSHRQTIGSGAVAVGSTYLLPIFVPKGSQILAAIRAGQVTGPPTAAFRIYPMNWFEGWEVGSSCTTYGAATASSAGTGVTGAAAAWGSWTQIVASTTGPTRWILPTIGSNNASQAAATRYFQLGVGSAGNEKIIGNHWQVATTTVEEVIVSAGIPVACDIPAGLRLAMRLWNSTGITAMQVCLHCFV